MIKFPFEARVVRAPDDDAAFRTARSTAVLISRCTALASDWPELKVRPLYFIGMVMLLSLWVEMDRFHNCCYRECVRLGGE
ncbi:MULTISPECIES: hypothetical protein [Devosia]|uniref:hypothetical protein n=1 Tax=Devosia TaxID=46913 RepID=UPI0018E4E041|nr:MULTISPECIES: hypothetical protein [Devosia]